MINYSDHNVRLGPAENTGLLPRLDQRRRGLALEDGKRLLQPGDLGLTTLLPLLVGLRLRDTLLLKLLQILQHRIQLRLRPVTIRRRLRNELLERGLLLALVLHVLLLRGLRDLVLLCGFVVLLLRGLLVCVPDLEPAATGRASPWMGRIILVMP